MDTLPKLSPLQRFDMLSRFSRQVVGKTNTLPNDSTFFSHVKSLDEKASNDLTVKWLESVKSLESNDLTCEKYVKSLGRVSGFSNDLTDVKSLVSRSWVECLA